MQFDGILFDLDGTLLPMDQEVFTKGYFQELAGALCPLGVEPEPLIAAVWAGVKAMVKNDGQQNNEAVFWDTFQAVSGLEIDRFRPVSDHFYKNGFHKAKVFTGPNPFAARAVALAHEKAKKVILATNPLFPLAGQATRLSWIGLKPEDFDLVTAYESDFYSKPNPAYYREICRRMDLRPEHCLMIGNDEREDMNTAASLGMKTYLVTDCRIPDPDKPWTGAQGSFQDMLKMLENLE